jgi:hypothetical protein
MIVNAYLGLVKKENVLKLKIAHMVIQLTYAMANFVNKMKIVILKIAFILCVLLLLGASQNILT